jgi:hypothetical protein
MFRPTADLIADTQPTSSLVPWMWGGLIVLVLIGIVLTSLSIEDADQEALGALNVAAVSVPTTVGQSAMYSQDNANPDIPIDAATAAANDANGGMSDPFQALENWH